MPPRFVFIGYLPKRILPRPEWLACPAVEFVASVSECISPAPPEHLASGQQNTLGLYDTADLATTTIPNDLTAPYTLFAYATLTVLFHDGRAIDWNPLTNMTTPPPTLVAEFDEHLGFDVVGLHDGSLFECSPLSCNGAAKDFGVNRFCLVDDVERAMGLAKDFSKPDSHVEPAWGYAVVDVRKRNDR